MTFDTPSLLSLAGRSVTEPKVVARELMAAGIPQTALWPALILVVVLSTLVSGGLNLAAPATGPFAEIMNRPFTIAIFTFSALVLTIFGLHWAGRMFGGQGRLHDMILVMTWFQAVLFVAQLALLVLTLVLPPLGALAFLGFLAASIWMSVAFVDAVHGFDSLLKSFGVIFFALLAIGFGLSLLLGMVGFGAGSAGLQGGLGGV